jgi:hypothetical protein
LLCRIICVKAIVAGYQRKSGEQVTSKDGIVDIEEELTEVGRFKP